jgi:hypothetical protein
MDAVKNISHCISLSLCPSNTLQIAGLARNIRYKYILANTLHNLYVTYNNHFKKKRLQVFFLSIEKIVIFPILMVYRNYTSCTGKFASLSIHHPIKQTVLYVGIFTPRHSRTSWIMKYQRGNYLIVILQR